MNTANNIFLIVANHFSHVAGHSFENHGIRAFLPYQGAGFDIWRQKCWTLCADILEKK